MTILSWYEHLSSKEIPPQWMWHLPEELERHFEHVKEQRKSGRPDDDDDDENWGPGPVIHNEYAKGRGKAVSA